LSSKRPRIRAALKGSVSNFVKINIKNKMKSIEEIQIDLDDLYLTNKSAKGLPYYNMKPSGDILKDFVIFTDKQCLKPSSDPNDWYIINGGHYPPKPDIDNVFKHTVRDITYDLFHAYCPKLSSEDFYKMTDEVKTFIVRKSLIPAILTNSDAINYLLGYCVWATGNCKKEIEFYKLWYGSTLQKDIDALGEKQVFIRLADIRKYRMSKSNCPGHLGGILCFYHIFINYCKK